MILRDYILVLEMQLFYVIHICICIIRQAMPCNINQYILINTRQHRNKMCIEYAYDKYMGFIEIINN